MDEIFDAPDWFEALTLAERTTLLGASPNATPSPERRERAARQASRWRRESELLDDGLFAERLARDGLTPDRFLRLLAAPATVLQQRANSRPAWLQLLARTFSQPLLPLPTEVEDGLGVLELLRPLIADAHARVLEGLRRIAAGTPGLLDAEPIAAALLATLIKRLRWASERALALELQASRLEGKLQGETPEERFRSFVERLRQPGPALEILRRYPVLARDACRHAEQWVETSLEMMQRFAADRKEIVRLLSAGADPGSLAAVQTGLSDRHAGGRSVAVFTFASGLKIVYKPKSLAVDRHLQTLIARLNEWGDELPLRVLAILDRGAYGWMEHVAARPCETPEEVERFHERQGAWLALFYVLEATDFHHENLIAEGEHPVPIDLETLFQPAHAAPAASGPGYLPTAHTVLNSGLLPRRFWATAEQAGLDLSGMGAAGGQKMALKRITGDGTDQMRWAGHETQLPAGPNLPTLRGEPLALWEHGDSVLRGFRATYRRLRQHREELLAPGGPLSHFVGLPVRALLRGTNVYAHLLHVGHHPDYLHNALDRDRLFDRLWLDAVGYPLLRQALRAEQADLTAGDVPRFETLPTSIDLLHAGGRIEAFFAAPGMERVEVRLRAMDEDDLERQSWLVEAAIEATCALDERPVWTPAALPEAGPAEPERFLRAARQIGDHLAHQAIEQGELVTWFHLDLRPDGWLLEPMPVDLYKGLCGLALFLAHLGRLAEEGRYERLARLALHTVRQRLAADPGALVRLGAFSGWGGLIYTLTHLGLLWEEPGLLDEAEGLASQIVPGIESDAVFDLLAGSAGAVAALLILHDHRPSRGLLEIAVRCGERLLAGAAVDERGHGWPPPADLDRLPLTGFSHGTAGIAWALARLAQATDEERFRDAARGALRYERSWFSPEHDNWPDLRASRETAEGRAFLHAWCHGAPGIGLGRIGTLPYLDDPEMLSEIRAAVRSTLAEGFGFNQSLCHGDLGNLELVREAGRVLGDEDLSAEADRLAARILARIESEGPRCGTNLRTESPGLMTGLAGIGYGLLRAAWPDRVPSVLLLETPQPREDD
ncbi:MAG TPA: type 2 lanthipeptide synthetase LanM family protein [Thermoanaerobaculia bacterium]|jgi:type 2 lantibiotic biosynthesis protein LanM|nr:type 2 lanthipeptide synthetase LanM family protein [Thermoanaerobaculia bacterium]